YVSQLPRQGRREQASLKRYGNHCITQLAQTTDASEYLEHLCAVAELYVQGYALDFENLFDGTRCSRVSLPTYPFAKDRYWVKPGRGQTIPQRAAETAQSSILHPLVHRKTSRDLLSGKAAVTGA